MYKQHPKLKYWISDRGYLMKARGLGEKKVHTTASGYNSISCNGRSYFVHRLVYEAFNGSIPNDLEINHINGIKNDNRLENLEVVTKSENIRHAIALGLKPAMVHETNGMAKLSESQYVELIQMILNGYSNTEIADKYGLHNRYISLVRGKKRLRSIWAKFNNQTIPQSGDNSKLSFENRLQLISDLAVKTNKQIASEYNLDPSTVSKIRHRKQWENIWEVFEQGATVSYKA